MMLYACLDFDYLSSFVVVVVGLKGKIKHKMVVEALALTRRS